MKKPKKKREPKPAQRAKDRQQRDSEDIERAVYDGMQDLRREKPESSAKR